jgi:hypothetical protein
MDGNKMNLVYKSILSILGMGAVFDAILVPSQVAPTVITALATVTASAEQVFGANEIFAINATGDVNIRFGPAGNVPTPSATVGFRIPAGSTMVFDVGRQWTSFKVFNTTAGNVNVYIQPLSKF